jgi:hypothetical protein
MSGHQDALPRLAIIYDQSLTDWGTRVLQLLERTDPRLAELTNGWLKERKKIARTYPKDLARQYNTMDEKLLRDIYKGLILEEGGITRKVGHWLRPYSVMNIEEFFGDMFAYYTLFPYSSRTFATDITDEFGNLIDEFVFGVKIKVDGKMMKFPKKPYPKEFFRYLKDVLRGSLIDVNQARGAYVDAQRRLFEQRRLEIKGVKIPKEIKLSAKTISTLKKEYDFYLALSKDQVQRLGFSEKEARAIMSLYHMRYSFYTKDVQKFVREYNIPRQWLYEEVDKIVERKQIMDLYNKIQARVKKRQDEPDIDLEKLLGYGDNPLVARSPEDAVRADLLPGPSGEGYYEPEPGGEE